MTDIQKGAKWQELPPSHGYTTFISMPHAVDHRHMMQSAEIKGYVTMAEEEATYLTVDFRIHEHW